MQDMDAEDPTSWLECFILRESAPKINLASKQALFDNFNATKNEEQTKAELLKSNKIVFIFKQNFGKNKINFFHHLSVTGGNFYNPKENFGIIQGIGEEVTSVVTPDMNQLLEISAIATNVPTIEDYLNVENLEDIRKLRNCKDTCYTARNFVPVPPFMLYKLNQAILDYDGDSQQTLLMAINTIKEFDEEIERSEENTIEKASTSCEQILHWLYLATKGKINSTPTIGCSVKEVQKVFQDIETAAGLKKSVNTIHPPMDTNANIQKPLEINAALSSSTQDFLSKITQIHSSSQEKTTNSFTNSPKKHRE